MTVIQTVQGDTGSDILIQTEQGDSDSDTDSTR